MENEIVAEFIPSSLEDWASVVQAITTVAAILVGGLIAYIRFGWFRLAKPHARISHRVSHRPIGTKYYHLLLDVTVTNTAKVMLDFRAGFIKVQLISPTDDETVEARYKEVFVDKIHNNMHWELVYSQELRWQKQAFVVEPGESDCRSYEFIVSQTYKAVLVESFFYNTKVADYSLAKSAMNLPRKNRFGRLAAGPLGWGTSTIYDLKGEAFCKAERNPHQNNGGHDASEHSAEESVDSGPSEHIRGGARTASQT